MTKKINSSVKIETLKYFKIVCIGFLFSILLVNCNSSDSNKATKPDTTIDSVKLADEIPYDSFQVLKSDTTKVNWLDGHGWDSVEIDANPDYRAEIYKEMEKIRFYALGALAEYNHTITRVEDPNVPYTIKEFKYAMKSRSPLQFAVIAYLTPPAREPHGPGGHIIPPAPPPPGK